MENKYFKGKFAKEFDKVTEDEKVLYTLYALSRFRQELKYLEKQYKDDDQKELFLMGYKNMIKKLEKQLKDVRLKYSYFKRLKDYIVQECKYYERAYSPDMEYFPRRELLGYIDAYYDLGLINDDEEEKIVYIVEKLYQYYQNYVTLFLSDELLKENGV